jgi:hypothetical protein
MPEPTVAWKASAGGAEQFTVGEWEEAGELAAANIAGESIALVPHCEEFAKEKLVFEEQLLRQTALCQLFDGLVHDEKSAAVENQPAKLRKSTKGKGQPD